MQAEIIIFGEINLSQKTKEKFLFNMWNLDGRGGYTKVQWGLLEMMKGERSRGNKKSKSRGDDGKSTQSACLQTSQQTCLLYTIIYTEIPAKVRLINDKI